MRSIKGSKGALRLLVLGVVAASCSMDASTPTSSPSGPPGITGRLTPATAPGRYIVVLKPGIAKSGVSGHRVVDVALAIQAAHGGKVIHTYQHALNGFAMTLSPERVAALRADDRVASVEPDSVVTLTDVQANPTWGIDRIDQRALPADHAYTYPGQAGEGVHAYVIDTGIYAAHSEFTAAGGGTRIGNGYDFIDNDTTPDDCYGHGTHVAGTLGGNTWGVAKKVTLHALRVFDCTGNGTIAGVLGAIDWATANRVGPAVVNMSLRAQFGLVVNNAVIRSINTGLTYVVSAGNNNTDACLETPASAPEAITVAATNAADTRSSFSNFGACVDLFAPGEGITSAYLGAPDATATISGTSMASPHAAGAAALWLGLHPTATPADVALALTVRATPNVVLNAGSASPNLLLFTGDLVGTGDQTPPGATIDAPADGSSVTDPTSITVTATATDDIGPVRLVQFLVNGVVVGSDSQAPWAFTWDTNLLNAGTYQLTVRAFDANANAGVSPTTNVTIQRSLPAVTLAPATVQGGVTTTGTLFLEAPAPAGGALFPLTSSDVNIALVPPSVFIPEGASSGPFPVMTLVRTATTTATVTISATLPGRTAATILNVVRSIRTSTVTVSPSTTLVGGTSATGTVQLVAATTSPTVVSLVSNNNAVRVPPAVTVPPGQTTATFPIATDTVASQLSAQINATAPVGLPSFAFLVILSDVSPASLTMNPATVAAGATSTGTVTLTGPAPVEGAVVALSSGFASNEALIPPTVTVPAGQSSATFTVTATSPFSTSRTITGTYRGTGKFGSLTVTATPGLGQLSVDNVAVKGGASAIGTARLTVSAATATVVALTSDTPGIAVPETVTIPAGQFTATFAITTATVAATTTATISGVVSGGVARTVALKVVPSPVPQSVTFDTGPLPAGQRMTARVTLDAPAPASGLVVNLTGALFWPVYPTPVVTVPASVTVPAGATSATFPVDTIPQAGTFTIFINASVEGRAWAGAMLDLPRTVIPGNALPGPLLAPTCSTVGAYCDSGSQIDGRGALFHNGPEIGAPNTINNSCADGEFANFPPPLPGNMAGTYHVDLSLDRLRVTTLDGSALAAGKTVRVDAFLWGSTGVSVDLFVASNAQNPIWRFVARVFASNSQESVVSTTFTLPSGSLQAIRGVLAGPAMQICSTGQASAVADFDDLVFATDNGGPPTNIGPTVNAGADQTIGLPPVATLAGVATDDGLPTSPGALTTTWSKVSGPGTVTFGDASVRNTTATFSLAGSYTLQLTATDGALSTSDTVVINVNNTGPSNTPPTVNAGPDQIVVLPSTATLAGSASDDGSPNPPGSVGLTWSVVSGPGTVAFDHVDQATPVVTFSVPGAYVLRLTATDGLVTAFDDVTITVNPIPNEAPVVNAGPDQTITLPATAALTGSAVDDGRPTPPGMLMVSWSSVAGPGTVTFASPGALSTTATFSAAGTYTLRLTANDGVLVASDDLVVTVNPAPINQTPTVNAGPDQTITLPAAASLVGTATDDGLPTPPGALTTTWSKVSGPGSVTFANANAKQTTAKFSTQGTYVLRLTARDGALSSSDTITVQVNPVPINKAPVVNAGPDQTITLPAAASLVGTATDDGLPTPPGALTTTWSKVSGPGSVTFANANAKQTTATFSTSGTYVLRLTASDGSLSASDTIALTVNAAPTLKVQYRIAPPAATQDAFLRPRFSIVNTGTTAIPLSQLKVRYWYTADGTRAQDATCDAASVGCFRVTEAITTVSPARPNADRFLEVGFTNSAGNLVAGSQTGEIVLHVNKTNFSAFNESNDHSYASTPGSAAPTALVDWTRVTLYRNGVRVWGTEP